MIGHRAHAADFLFVFESGRRLGEDFSSVVNDLILLLFDRLCLIQSAFGLFAVDVGNLVGFLLDALPTLLFYLGLTDDQRTVSCVFYFKIGFYLFCFIFLVNSLQNNFFILINRSVHFHIQNVIRVRNNTEFRKHLPYGCRQRNQRMRIAVCRYRYLKGFCNMNLHFIIDAIVQFNIHDILI